MLAPVKPQFSAPRKDSIRTSSDSDDQMIDVKRVLTDPKRTKCDGCGAVMLKKSISKDQKLSCPNRERRADDGAISVTESITREVASGSKPRAARANDAIFKVPRLRSSSASVTSQEPDRETDEE